MFLNYQINEKSESLQFEGSARDLCVVCARMITVVNSRLTDSKPKDAELFKKIMVDLVNAEDNPLWEYVPTDKVTVDVLGLIKQLRGERNDKD